MASSLRRRDAFRVPLKDLSNSLPPREAGSIRITPKLSEEGYQRDDAENQNPRQKKPTNRTRANRKTAGLEERIQLTPHPFTKDACNNNNNNNAVSAGSCKCRYTPELLEMSCDITFNETMDINSSENEDCCYEGRLTSGRHSSPDMALCVCYDECHSITPNADPPIYSDSCSSGRLDRYSTSSSGTWAGEELLLADFEEFAVNSTSLESLESRDSAEEIPAGIRDIDARSSSESHLNGSDFAKDIMKYLQDLEQKHKITESWVNIGETTHGMRGLLIDWLIQVQNHLHMDADVLWLTMSMLNSYLSKYPVALVDLQLVGITCLMIAKKYEDAVDAAEVSNLIHLTDNSYTKQQVLNMELEILSKMSFDLSLATPMQFLKRFLMALPDYTITLEHLTCYLMELCLTDAKCITFLPSEYAAACLYLSYHLLDEKADWGPDLIYYTGYTEPELCSCLERIATNVIKADKSKFNGAKAKYASVSRYSGVSSMGVLKNSLICRRLSHRSTS